jgi:F-type H+-transporting ATPase subunit b
MNPLIAANLLAPNVGLIFWMVLTFGSLWFVLWKYAWGPITSALSERESRISESMEQAEKALEEAKQLQADNTKARREAELEAQRMIREARDAADQLRSDEVEKTRTELENLQDQARQEIEREKDSALESLRQDVADLAIEAAEKILREQLDGAKQKQLVEDFLKSLPKN